MKPTTTIFSIIVATLFCADIQVTSAQDLNKKVKKYATQVVAEFDQIDEERKATLKEIGDFIVNELKEKKKADIIVICTHNSRRSHISQAWLQAAALYYGIDALNVFSGGLQVTAFHPNAVAALERAGFSISKSLPAENPRYTVSNGSGSNIHYSKQYTDRQNPQQGFGAILVCSDADESCPMVEGAAARFSLPFEDPRYYDGIPSQDMKYDETVRLVAREMFYIADYVKSRINVMMEAKKASN